MKNQSGMIIISILMLTVVITMLTTSLVMVNYYNSGFANLAEDRVAALKAAESGITYAIYCLNEEPTWQPTVKISVPMVELPGRFEITFDPNSEYYSVNNLSDQKRGGAWGGGDVPGFSVDLIVTGIIEKGDRKVVKRVRAILQKDYNYPGSFSSGQTVVDANTIDIRKESTAENPSEAGTLHSNSIKTGPINPAIKTFNASNKTNVFLHGGIASSAGEIDIKSSGISKNLDTENNSSVDPVKQSKNVHPIDIEKTLEKANNTLPSASKVNLTQQTTYVVYKDRVEPALPSSICEVTDGQLHIKDDLFFNANGNEVKFEFDYSYADPSSENYDPSIDIASSGIYLDPSEEHIPAIYVDRGNLTVAGSVRGNGSVYITGEGTFIGESNIVGPDESGVAILASDDLTMKLPSCRRKQLDIDVTGLVYSHGNINMDILEPDDMINPANNLAGTQWPSDWEDTVLARPSGDTLSLPFNYSVSSTGSYETSGMGIVGGGGPSQGYTLVTGDYVNFNGSSGSFIRDNGNGTYTLHTPQNISASCKLRGQVFNYDFDSAGGLTLVIPDDINTLIGDGGGLGVSYATGLLVQMISAGFASKTDQFIAEPVDPDAPKIDPAFHMTGGVVAIDPNNPVPSLEKPESNTSGKLNIDIKQGNFFIVSSKRYLKLLESAKAQGGSLKAVTWGEI